MEKEQLSVEIRPEVARGTYSSFAIIGHGKNEFILDFISKLPGMPKAEVTNRVIMSPEACKNLLMALGDNIEKYEKRFGEIATAPRGATINLADIVQHGTKS